MCLLLTVLLCLLVDRSQFLTQLCFPDACFPDAVDGAPACFSRCCVYVSLLSFTSTPQVVLSLLYKGENLGLVRSGDLPTVSASGGVRTVGLVGLHPQPHSLSVLACQCACVHSWSGST